MILIFYLRRSQIANRIYLRYQICELRLAKRRDLMILIFHLRKSQITDHKLLIELICDSRFANGDQRRQGFADFDSLTSQITNRRSQIANRFYLR